MLKDYEWRRFDRYIDIGGAYGSFLASLLSRRPAAKGVLFDQLQVCQSKRAASNEFYWTVGVLR